MRVTIIPEDKWIRKDNVSAKLPEWNFNDPDIHAIQWYDTKGEIEYKETEDSPQRNESITDDSILQPYLDALSEYLDNLSTSSLGIGTSDSL
jgi:hypothetical protein